MRHFLSILLIASVGVLSACAPMVPAPQAPVVTQPDTPPPAEEAPDATPIQEEPEVAEGEAVTEEDTDAEDTDTTATPQPVEAEAPDTEAPDTETPDTEAPEAESPEETAEDETATEAAETEEEAAEPDEDEAVTGVVEHDETEQEPMETTEPIGLQLVAEGLTAPVYLTTPRNSSGELFIVDQAGMIHVVDENGELLTEPFLDLRDRLVELRSGFDERGALGLAFHPEYEENGRFFVYYSAPLRDEAPEDWNHTGHVSEFSVSEDNPYRADPESERIIMEIDQPQFNHNGGSLIFGPDGNLYIALGDGGDADDTGLGHPDIGNGQDTTTLLGSILRINVDGEEPYEIPLDNPFIDASILENGNGEADDTANGDTDENDTDENDTDENGNDSVMIEGLGEIYAFGLRNPYRISWDINGEGEGTLYAADVGQHLFEEVNIITAGGNYGWNIKEGTHCFSPDSPFEPPAECPDTGHHGEELIDPVIEYLNVKAEGGLGSSIIGGYIYRGSALADFEGDYIFGDYSLQLSAPAGRLFVATPQDGDELWSMREIPIANAANEQLGHFLLSFGQDHEGELYILVSQSTAPVGNTGRVFKLVPAGEGSDLTGILNGEAMPEDEADDATTDETDAETDEADDDAAEEADEDAAVDEEAAETVTIDLVAQNIEFDQETITVPAGARVVIEFTNLDTVEHNFSLYETADLANPIFVGELIGGPNETITYEFDAPDEPGTYHFICDPHPVDMRGDFIVE